MEKRRWFLVLAALVLSMVPQRVSAACTGFPAGTATNDYVLLMSGTPKITNKGNAGTNGIAGAVAYDSGTNTLQVCNGTTWQALSTSSGAISSGSAGMCNYPTARAGSRIPARRQGNNCFGTMPIIAWVSARRHPMKRCMSNRMLLRQTLFYIRCA
jgi:hypothetical protein